MTLAEALRSHCKDIRILTHCGGGNFKKQIKRADKSGAQLAVIVGESELANNTVSVKYLRDHNTEQKTIEFSELLELLKVDGKA